MNISQLIEKDYCSCSILEDMDDLFEWLKNSAYLVVVDEELKVAGVVNQNDLINHPTGRIIDFDFSKPIVSPEISVTEAFKLMLSSRNNCLPVYEKNEFVGIISHCVLTRHLIMQIDRYKLIFQQVVHDLRNPIANIIGLNRLLQENLQNAEDIEITEMTKEVSIHALDILSGLLFIEKKENDQSGIEITNLNTFIKDSLSDLKGILSAKHVELVCEIPEEEFLYLIDRLHLKRTIHNLASNAIKFSYPNSKIHVSSKISRNTFILKIQDQGIGIPQNKQAFIFDQFTPASRPGTNGEPSTGLGLYFAKACIERFKGKIWFDSTEGQGTTFFIEFKT